MASRPTESPRMAFIKTVGIDDGCGLAVVISVDDKDDPLLRVAVVEQDGSASAVYLSETDGLKIIQAFGDALKAARKGRHHGE
jgi:hypothetical protein